MEEYEDPDNESNSPKYHTGQECIEDGCTNPAGTAWSPHFCFECNSKRFKKIDAGFDKLLKKFKEKVIMGETKTSVLWCLEKGVRVPRMIQPLETKIEMFDPDGWDRKDLWESFHEEIDEKEFNNRLSMSTISILKKG